MITLYQFPPLWNLDNVSPFCLKMETYLKLANIPHQVKIVNDPRRAPKGKLPFIKDGEHVISDSGIIMDYLKHVYGDPLDDHLKSFRRAQGVAWQRLFEEHLYWVMVYSRWMDATNWPLVKESFFRRAPLILRSYIANRVRKNVRNALYAQGMGRHSKDEIYKLGLDDLNAIKVVLTEQSYLLGDVITSVDAIGYAFLINIMNVPVESPLKEMAISTPCFQHYCERVRDRLGSAAAVVNTLDGV